MIRLASGKVLRNGDQHPERWWLLRRLCFEAEAIASSSELETYGVCQLPQGNELRP